MSNSTPRIRTYGGAFAAGERPRAAANLERAAAWCGTEAVESHDLIPVGHTSRVVFNGAVHRVRVAQAGFDRFPILLKTGHRAGRVQDLEHHFDLTRETLLAPARVEDYLHHIARRVPRRKLRERREERLGAAGPGSGRGGLVRAGFGFSLHRRRSLGRFWLLGFGGFDYVFEALNAVSAAGRMQQ